MKTIKIFLASSEELKTDRDAFGNLIRRLNKVYEKRGIHIDLFEWEDYDAAYNGQRKQDEYNEEIRSSQMFLAIFHTKAGKFTIEEFDIATEEFKKHASPKIYTYCKDLQEGEQETEELIAFKKRLLDELGHYWCRYNNSDSMQLHFVLQLQLIESNQREDLKLENGIISLGGMTIARMDELQFASGNEAYQKMSHELSILPEEIKKAEERKNKYPDDQDLVDDWQKKLDRYHELDKEFTQLQQALFNTAKQISKMQLERTNAKLHRAIEAFEEGNLELANFLLDEIAHEADQHMAQLEQDRLLVHKDIDALLLQANTVLADTSINIEERVARVESIYAKADDWAIKSDYDKKKHLDLLYYYADFLRIYANKFDKALENIERHIELCNKIFGEDYLKYAYYLYDFIADIYSSKGQYDYALEFYLKSIEIQEEILEDSDDKLEIANTYDHIGDVYFKSAKIQQALQYYTKALDIRINELSEKHSDIALSYINIGCVLRYQGKTQEAIDYLSKALEIQSTTDDNSILIAIYTELGRCCFGEGSYSKAIDYYQKALELQINEYGLNHLSTAAIYSSIGEELYNRGKYTESLDYHNKAISIERKIFGEDHPSIAESYDSMGMVYSKLGEFSEAFGYFSKALSIREATLEPDNIQIATSYMYLALAFLNKGNFSEALEYNFKALAIKEKALGSNHPDVAGLYCSIGQTYTMQENFREAKAFLQKALVIQESNSPSLQIISQTYQLLGSAYLGEKDYANALRCFQKVIEIQDEILNPSHLERIEAYNLIGQTYIEMAEFDKAMEFLQKAISVIESNSIPDYPTIDNVYCNLGRVYLYKKEYPLALEYFNKAVSAIEKTVGSENFRCGIFFLNIGLTHCYLGEYQNALEIFLKALPIIETYYGPNHIQTSDLYHLMGVAYHNIKDYPKALQYYEKALAIRIDVLGENHPETQATMQNIEMISPTLQHKKPSRSFFSRWFKK